MQALLASESRTVNKLLANGVEMGSMSEEDEKPLIPNAKAIPLSRIGGLRHENRSRRFLDELEKEAGKEVLDQLRPLPRRGKLAPIQTRP